MRRDPKIMVHVVAYNAASTLSQVLDRIPESLRPQLAEIAVFDDASKDDTFLVGKGYQATRAWPNLSVHKNAQNRGYGGNQKLGYRYAIEKGYDIVVLLHGDGQYAPEAMPDLIRPVAEGRADAVFGSRMMIAGAARKGGMPLYKFVGNKILTAFENSLLGMQLSEFHSGYRVYSTEALARIPFEQNTDDFHFDTQIIIQLKAGGFRIAEVPIPTYYGDEISRVNGFKYARDVMLAVVDFRRHQAGIADRPEYAHVQRERYPLKRSPFSSHRRIVDAVRPGTRVLDVGCAGGLLASALRDKGCTVIGVDAVDEPAAREACHRFYLADLDGDAWEPEERDFDFVLYGDVLEHLRDTSLLERSRSWLAPGGRVIASTGNVAFLPVRLGLLAGKFDYAARGILDRTHVHLYTRKSFRELLERAGFEVVVEDSAIPPFEALLERRAAALAPLEVMAHRMGAAWPELFAYQIVLEAVPAASSR
jgi:2-polyprenyl-3-methyl-5-hydroxy-6-metoxy-1,4-benzoquinol methylase